MVKSWTIVAAAAGSLCAIIAGAYLSLPVVTAVLCLASVVIGFGWPHLLRVPAKKTLGSIIAAAGIASALSAALLDAGRVMQWFPVIVALGVGAVFVAQLLRGAEQQFRLESTLGATTGVLLCAMGGGWVGAERLRANMEDSGMMLVTGVSVAVALLISALPWPDRVAAPVGLILATLAGPLGSMLFADVPNIAASVVGAVCGAVIVSFRRLALTGGGPRTMPGALAVGVAPIAALGALIYFLEKLLLV